MRTRFLIATLLVLALAPLARADGLPIADASAPAMIGGDGTDGRFVALPTERGTVVARIGSSVYASRLLDGRYTVPVVALDHTAAGLSTDGSTLVLINPRRTFPRTSFVVLGAKSLRTQRQILLQGDFSFDALSPDGRRMFLIHYLSRRDPTRYEVRALDIPSGNLLPTPIVDKSQPDERMAGLPITRQTTADGRWAYTLYDGAGHEPFVHALNTIDGEAHCIDLEMLAGRQDLYDLRLDLGQGDSGLAVLSGSERVAVIDRSTFEPVRARTAASASHEAYSRNWAAIVLLSALAVLAAAAAIFGFRRVVGDRSARGARPAPERRSSLRA